MTPLAGGSDSDDRGRPSWRSLLPADGLPGYPELALGVELRQREPHDPHRWDPRKIEAATPRSLSRQQDGLQLAVRPLARSARGSWVKKDAAWDDVRRTPSRFDPAVARWFAELFGIARPSAGVGSFSSVSEWLTLDSDASSLLWSHLEAGGRLGIPLVAPHPQQEVELSAAAAEVGVLVAPTDDGALSVTARVTLDGADTDVGRVRAVGRSMLFTYSVHTDPIRITLAPAALDDTVGSLLASPGGVVVPPHEAEEFLREAYPRLHRRTTMTAAAGLDPPTVLRPALRLTAAFVAESVGFRFEWSYPGLAPVAVSAAEGPDRDAAAEAALLSRAQGAWAEATDLPFTAAGTLRDADAGEFSVRVLAALQLVDGVRVEITGARPPYRELTGAPEVSVSTVATDDPDWFDLGVIVTIEGRWVPLAPLLTALSRGKRRLKLADGAYFSLAHPSLARLKELLDEAAALDEWETGARINRHQSALWSDFEDLADEAAPAQTWREAVRALEPADLDATPVPRGLRAELREYQKRGFDWLVFLHRQKLGGILADDMGLGKTVQMLALIQHAREDGEQRPFLVVAPTSVLATWLSESAQFVPDLVVRAVESTAAKSGTAVADAAAGAHVVVTSYALLRLDEAQFTAQTWAGVVFDEAQFVKNPQTRVHRAAKNLRADTVIALTGTPLENGLADLWALFSLTAPGLFPSGRRFRDEYVTPIEKSRNDDEKGRAHGAARLERLRRRIRPFMLRRTKEIVAPELPPKQEQDLHIELSAEHRALYDVVLQRERQKVLGLIDDLDRNRFIVFRSLTLLRMLSLDPVLVDERHAHIGSSKLAALLARLTEVIAEGHRALVFSQFTSFLSLVADRLDAAGIAYAHLDGSTSRRGEVVDGFRTGDAPVFLISLKAGGFGLTLTEADYVFVLDPWWNPTAEAQAIDRAHRIGQKRSVFVYRLLAAGTIEQKVRMLQQRKAELFRSVVDDGDLFSASLTADDIRALLDP
ncbi:DEAD/DEAH box helicase [Microbacterium sp. P06]|uniref:DEAD/DEAH box helicase n=1 Tax=Microbacterium sp. P06 TaxID=3366949 RepID=UPI00374557C9